MADMITLLWPHSLQTKYLSARHILSRFLSFIRLSTVCKSSDGKWTCPACYALLHTSFSLQFLFYVNIGKLGKLALGEVIWLHWGYAPDTWRRGLSPGWSSNHGGHDDGSYGEERLGQCYILPKVRLEIADSVCFFFKFKHLLAKSSMMIIFLWP